MTERLKNYDYNPSNLVKTLDDTMTMTNNIIKNNMEALDQYQRTLEREAKEMTPEKQKQEVQSIKNVQQGTQVLTHKLINLNTALNRMTQMLVQNDLEEKAQKQAQTAREQAAWGGSSTAMDNMRTQTNKKMKAPATKQTGGFTQPIKRKK